MRRASGICLNNYEFCESERSLQLVGGLHVVDVCYAVMLFGVCAGIYFLKSF